MNENEATADILRRAGERVSRGWTQGEIEEGDKVCALGAITYVCASLVSPKKTRAENALEDWLERNFGQVEDTGGLVPVAYWNDRKETSQEDVVLWFKRAAEELETE